MGCRSVSSSKLCVRLVIHSTWVSVCCRLSELVESSPRRVRFLEGVAAAGVDGRFRFVTDQAPEAILLVAQDLWTQPEIFLSIAGLATRGILLERVGAVTTMGSTVLSVLELSVADIWRVLKAFVCCCAACVVKCRPDA